MPQRPPGCPLRCPGQLLVKCLPHDLGRAAAVLERCQPASHLSDELSVPQVRQAAAGVEDRVALWRVRQAPGELAGKVTEDDSPVYGTDGRPRRRPGQRDASRSAHRVVHEQVCVARALPAAVQHLRAVPYTQMQHEWPGRPRPGSRAGGNEAAFEAAAARAAVGRANQRMAGAAGRRGAKAVGRHEQDVNVTALCGPASERRGTVQVRCRQRAVEGRIKLGRKFSGIRTSYGGVKVRGVVHADKTARHGDRVARRGRMIGPCETSASGGSSLPGSAVSVRGRPVSWSSGLA
jgi:hypothetical protein